MGRSKLSKGHFVAKKNSIQFPTTFKNYRKVFVHRRHLQVVVAVVVVAVVVVAVVVVAVVVVVVAIEVVVVLLWYYLAPKLQHSNVIYSTCLKSLKSLFLQLKLQKWDLNPSLF